MGRILEKWSANLQNFSMYIKFLLINFKSPIKILFGHDVTELKFDAFNFVNIIAVPPDFVTVPMSHTILMFRLNFLS